MVNGAAGCRPYTAAEKQAIRPPGCWGLGVFSDINSNPVWNNGQCDWSAICKCPATRPLYKKGRSNTLRRHICCPYAEPRVDSAGECVECTSNVHCDADRDISLIVNSIDQTVETANSRLCYHSGGACSNRSVANQGCCINNLCHYKGENRTNEDGGICGGCSIDADCSGCSVCVEGICTPPAECSPPKSRLDTNDCTCKCPTNKPHWYNNTCNKCPADSPHWYNNTCNKCPETKPEEPYCDNPGDRDCTWDENNCVWENCETCVECRYGLPCVDDWKYTGDTPRSNVCSDDTAGPETCTHSVLQGSEDRCREPTKETRNVKGTAQWKNKGDSTDCTLSPLASNICQDRGFTQTETCNQRQTCGTGKHQKTQTVKRSETLDKTGTKVYTNGDISCTWVPPYMSAETICKGRSYSQTGEDCSVQQSCTDKDGTYTRPATVANQTRILIGTLEHPDLCADVDASCAMITGGGCGSLRIGQAFNCCCSQGYSPGCYEIPGFPPGHMNSTGPRCGKYDYEQRKMILQECTEGL